MDELTTTILKNCHLFETIPEEKYPNILNCLSANYKNFKKGETVVTIGETDKSAGIVLEGTVELAFYDENGHQVIHNHIHSGILFGSERACCDWCESMIELKCLTDSRILFLQFNHLLEAADVSCPYRTMVTSNLLKEFARQIQFLNFKLQIISQKKLRDKLKIYLRTLNVDENNTVTVPYNRNEFSDFLGADRSALSRELCRMRDDGLIRFDGSRIQILDADFF